MTKKQQTFSRDPAPLPAPFEACRVQSIRCLGPDIDPDDCYAPTAPQVEVDDTGADMRKALGNLKQVRDDLLIAVSNGLPLQIACPLFRTAAA